MAQPTASPEAVWEGPVQIITVNETGDAFTLHEKKVKQVLDQIPEDLHIAVLSVVGAFRTGKSFLLDLFLRYLRFYDERPEAVCSLTDSQWLSWDALEGQANVGSAVPTHSVVPPSSTSHHILHGPKSTHSEHGHASVHSVSDRAGFKWRSGNLRTTTGIWFWSRPFIRTLPSGERVGVILMDTQGLFDNDTNQMLTTCIFGLSTLISSYVVYNLKDRIQEDNLQHLALFSEYARKVQQAQEDESTSAADGAPQTLKQRKQARQGGLFQRMELLVRDAIVEADASDPAAVQAEVDDYFKQVLSKTHNEDLRSVRELIKGCYEELACYMLPHPSLDVTRKDYDGNSRVLRDDFKRLLHYFVHGVFNKHMTPKKVNGRVVTAPQLLNFVCSYARLFQEKAVFPEARVLLDATAEANNKNATDAALRHYDVHMDALFAEGYQSDDVVSARSQELTEAALDIFDQIADFGPQRSIDSFKLELQRSLATRQTAYLARNKERNPLKNVEVIVFALAVIFAGWIMKFLLDFTCAPFSDICRRGSQMFAFISSLTLLALLGVIFFVGKTAMSRIQAIVSALLGLVSGDARLAGLAHAVNAVMQPAPVGQMTVPTTTTTQAGAAEGGPTLRQRSQRREA